MAVSDEEIGLETPEADRLEQVIPVVDDPDEASVGEVEVGGVLDANEADVLEQAIPVAPDEDYPADGA